MAPAATSWWILRAGRAPTPARRRVAARFPVSGFGRRRLPLRSTQHYLNGQHKARAGEEPPARWRSSPPRPSRPNVEHDLVPLASRVPPPQASCGQLQRQPPNRRYPLSATRSTPAPYNDTASPLSSAVERAVARTPGTPQLQLRPRVPFSTAKWGPTDCYGSRRWTSTGLPTSRTAPTAASVSCSTSGSFTPCRSRLPAALHPGHHVLTIRAGDHASQLKNIAGSRSPSPAIRTGDRVRDRRHRSAAQGGCTTRHQATGWASDWES